jgi:hypothetical protein
MPMQIASGVPIPEASDSPYTILSTIHNENSIKINEPHWMHDYQEMLMLT